MPDRSESNTSREARLEQVLAECLRALEAGQTVDRVSLVALNPDLADDLRSFFHNRDAMQQLAEPLRASGSSGDAVTIGLDGAAAGGATRVRYFGDYELLGEIARGGMGVVYRARQVSLNRTVALKMILAAQLASADDVRRFQQEAEAAANLDHPHIVPIYEIGEHEGQHYFSMKLIEGGSLGHRLKTNAEPLPARETAQLVATVARAVHHAHQRGLLHRDLKPGNILLDATGQPHVTDFGLAKRVEGDSDLTHSGAVVGTPAYMAPEQARAETQLTTSADVYSLGAILYELLVGRPPFRADSAAETLVHVLNNDPAPPRSVNPRADRDLETICLKCLEKESARRYDSAAALADDLDRWLQGEPIEARPCTVWERARKWAKRRPAIAAMTTAIVVLAFVGMAGVTWQWREAVAARQFADGQTLTAVQQRLVAERERDVAGRNLYVAHMHLARAAWEAADTARLQEMLARQTAQPGRRDFRGWEWHYLDTQSRGLLSLSGHTATITCVAWSPDGKRVATGAAESSLAAGEIKLWDAITGRELLAFGGRTKYGIRSIAWSPDGSRLVAGGGNLAGFHNNLPGELKVWDTHNGKEVLALRGHKGHVNSVTWSSDGRRLASASGEFGPPGEVKIWDATTGDKLFDLNGHTNEVNAVAWSPDDKCLASTCADGTIKIWDTEFGKELQTLKGHQRAVFQVVWSPSGKQLATTSADPSVKVWDIAMGKDVSTIPMTQGVNVSWPPEAGQLELANGDGTIQTWNLTTRKVIKTTKLSVRSFFLADWTAGRRRIALACGDQTIKLVDLAPVPEAQVLRAGTTPVAAVVWDQDGKRLATTGDDIVVWDVATGGQIKNLPWPSGWSVINAAWSPDGHRLVSSSLQQFSGTIKVWDTDTAKELFVWNAHIGPAFGLAWSPDGLLLATGGMDKMVRLWDAKARDKEIATLEGHTEKVYSVAWHPQQHWLASASEDGTVRLWDPKRGKETILLRGHGGRVRSVTWSPEGKRLASAGVDGIKVWDPVTRQELLSLRGHSGPVGKLAWQPDADPDRQRLASLGDDGTLKLWDLVAGQEVMTLRGNKASLVSLAWSPDGRQLASGSYDGTINVWSSLGPRPNAAPENATKRLFDIVGVWKWAPTPGVPVDISSTVTVTDGKFVRIACKSTSHGDGKELRRWTMEGTILDGNEKSLKVHFLKTVAADGTSDPPVTATFAGAQGGPTLIISTENDEVTWHRVK